VNTRFSLMDKPITHGRDVRSNSYIISVSCPLTSILPDPLMRDVRVPSMSDMMPRMTQPLTPFANTTEYKLKVDVSSDIVNQSHIGKIAYGEDKIEVKGHETDIMYEFDRTSRPCVIGLSINENLVFTQVDISKRVEELKSEAQTFVTSIKNKQFSDFLKGKTYDSDACIICLMEEPKCDSIIFTCAHKCTHFTCLTETLDRCPVCRTHVVATLKVDSRNPQQIEEVKTNSPPRRPTGCVFYRE